MVWGRNVREIFVKSLHRNDRLVYRLLTLNFVSFSLKLVPDNCLQLLTAMVAYTDGYTDVTLLELFELRTHEFCLRFCTHIN